MEWGRNHCHPCKPTLATLRSEALQALAALPNSPPKAGTGPTLHDQSGHGGRGGVKTEAYTRTERAAHSRRAQHAQTWRQGSYSGQQVHEMNLGMPSDASYPGESAVGSPLPIAPSTRATTETAGNGYATATGGWKDNSSQMVLPLARGRRYQSIGSIAMQRTVQPRVGVDTEASDATVHTSAGGPAAAGGAKPALGSTQRGSQLHHHVTVSKQGKAAKRKTQKAEVRPGKVDPHRTTVPMAPGEGDEGEGEGGQQGGPAQTQGLISTTLHSLAHTVGAVPSDAHQEQQTGQAGGIDSGMPGSGPSSGGLPLPVIGKLVQTGSAKGVEVTISQHILHSWLQEQQGGDDREGEGGPSHELCSVPLRRADSDPPALAGTLTASLTILPPPSEADAATLTAEGVPVRGRWRLAVVGPAAWLQGHMQQAGDQSVTGPGLRIKAPATATLSPATKAPTPTLGLPYRTCGVRTEVPWRPTSAVADQSADQEHGRRGVTTLPRWRQQHDAVGGSKGHLCELAWQDGAFTAPAVRLYILEGDVHILARPGTFLPPDAHGAEKRDTARVQAGQSTAETRQHHAHEKVTSLEPEVQGILLARARTAVDWRAAEAGIMTWAEHRVMASLGRQLKGGPLLDIALASVRSRMAKAFVSAEDAFLAEGGSHWGLHARPATQEHSGGLRAPLLSQYSYPDDMAEEAVLALQQVQRTGSRAGQTSLGLFAQAQAWLKTRAYIRELASLEAELLACDPASCRGRLVPAEGQEQQGTVALRVFFSPKKRLGTCRVILGLALGLLLGSAVFMGLLVGMVYFTRRK